MIQFIPICCVFGIAFCCSAQAPARILFKEDFENTNFAGRGWYDNTRLALSSAEHIAGSTRSAEYHWRRGATTPDSGGAIRRKFTPSDSIYVSYWVKYSSNYTGSNRPYHPHEFNLLTTENGDWTGPAYTRLTGYIEQNEGIPVLSLQDSENIDESQIGQDLISVTENRAVAGCNGNHSDGYATVSCYPSGSVHRNGKSWKAAQIYFQDAPGLYDKSTWHQVAAFFKLNSIADGLGQADGQLKYWYDGALVIDRTNVIMRTAARPNMKWNQFLIAPYIGDGSPADQTMWVDDLVLATERFVADADNDGLPDDWELAHGLNPANASDSGTDPDEDGFSNRAEYLAGTDPRNSTSLLRISSIALSEQNTQVTFETAQAKRYHLERSAALVNSSWSQVAVEIIGDGGTIQVVDAESPLHSPRFYRLKLTSTLAEGSP